MDELDIKTLVAEALAASARGDSAQAVDLLHVAANRPDADGIPCLLLAAEQASLGRMPEAEAAYAESILRSPDLAVARFQLGLLQVSSGRSSMGILTWQPLLMRPDDDALRRYVEGYIALANDHFAQAIELFALGLSFPQDNESLTHDVRTTVAALEQHLSGQSARVDNNPEAEMDHHILLSNYAAGSMRH